jgi:predicted permease
MIRRLFNLPPAPHRVERDAEDEMSFHITMRVEELMAGGMAPAAAREQAEREFGDRSEARAELAAIDRRRLRGMRHAMRLDALQSDLRYAARGLRREPLFALAVIATLAVAIGMNTTMLGIADRLLLRAPPHIADPDAVSRVYVTETRPRAGTITQTGVSWPDYAALRTGVASFAEAGAWFSRDASLGRGREARQIRIALASASYFTTLGTQPALGRFYTEDEDNPAAGEPPVVVSHGLWQRHFGGSRAALGSTLVLDNRTYRVIGVAPAGFRGLDHERLEAWVPLSVAAEATIGNEYRTQVFWRWLRVVTRLREGAEASEAASRATALYVSLNAESRRANAAQVGLGPVLAARGPAVGTGTDRRNGRVALWLAGVSLAVLVIACANVTSLLLGRAVRRRREIAVRVALGISRGRLLGQTLVEGGLLTLLGGIAGLLLAAAAGGVARAFVLPELEWSGGIVDARVMAATLAIMVCCAVVLGLAPGWYALNPGVASILKDGARGGTLRRSRSRSALVVLQAAISVVLLVGAGLFVLSLREVRAIDLGFDAEALLAVEWDRSALGYDAARHDELYREAARRVELLPGVEAAAVAITTPFWSSLAAQLSVPGLDSLPAVADGGPYYNAVTPSFFTTTGTGIVRGRGFTAADGEGSSRVAVVSETMARMVWPGEDALGRCLVIGGPGRPCSTVIGIARDARRQTIEGGPVLHYYLPLDQKQVGASLRVLFVRLRGDRSVAIGTVRGAIQSIAPDLPAANIRLLSDLVDPQLRPWRLGAILFSAFGTIAVLLATLGLYAVVSYSVSQRSHELGVRRALGALPRHLVRLVCDDAARLVVPGVMLGVVVAYAGSQAIAPLLYRVSPREPVVFAGVALLLMAAGLLATVLPALRALKADPVRALAGE